MRYSLAISTENLSPPSRDAFERVLAVAKTRSVADWEIKPAAEANVVCLMPESAAAADPLKPDQLRVWFASRNAVKGLSSDSNLVFDPFGIRVINVLNMLERAAVRFMDNKAYPRYQGAARGAPATSVQPAGEVRYRLRYWAALSGPFATRRHLTAAAMISQRALTENELVSASGLTSAQAQEFLAELGRIGALAASGVTTTPLSVPEAANEAEPARPAPVSRGIVRRLRDWLSRASA